MVPVHQVEQVLADGLLAGVLRSTQLHCSMHQRAGQEEALVAVQEEQEQFNPVRFPREASVVVVRTHHNLKVPL